MLLPKCHLTKLSLFSPLFLDAPGCSSPLLQGKSYISPTHTDTQTVRSLPPHPSIPHLLRTSVCLYVRPSVFVQQCVSSSLLGAGPSRLPTCLLWSGEWGVSLATATLQLFLTPPISPQPPPSLYSSPPPSPPPPLVLPPHTSPLSHTTAGLGSTCTACWTKGRWVSTRTPRTPPRPITMSHCSTCPTATAMSPTATRRRRTSSHSSEDLFPVFFWFIRSNIFHLAWGFTFYDLFLPTPLSYHMSSSTLIISDSWVFTLDQQ